MAVKKSDMKQEAIERMKLLGLDEQIISDFQKKTSVIYLSENENYGELTSIYKVTKGSDIIFEDIKKIEKETGWLVYHVIRAGNWLDCLNVLLCVTPHPEEWDMIKDWLKRTKRIMDCYVYPQNAPNFYEVGEVEIKTQNGGLVKLN
ncbi:MAG: hypothetical protein IJS40_01860 [Synergistaceae bacterium]|nr:hypothetical protein [Synergistaceae bacterium]